MGHIESSPQGQNNCFAACIRNKRIPQQNLSPNRPLKRHLSEQHSHKTNHKKNVGIGNYYSPKKAFETKQTFDTQLERKLEDIENNAKIEYGTPPTLKINKNSQKTTSQKENSNKETKDESESIIPFDLSFLDLESKCSITRKTANLSKKQLESEGQETIDNHKTPQKTKEVISDGKVASFWEKQQHTKASETSHAATPSSSKSRDSNTLTRIMKKRQSLKNKKVILNKIEEIKQKYYERQLEIQIYVQEKNYEEQLQKIKQVQKQCNEHPQYACEAELNEITVIREKIKHKMTKIKQESQSVDYEISQNDGLELFSRDDIRIRDRISKQSLKRKYHKRDRFKKDVQTNQENNNFLNISIQQKNKKTVKQQEKIQFSELSASNLKEIKEVAEEEEEYKSKMNSRIPPFQSKQLLSKASIYHQTSDNNKGENNKISKLSSRINSKYRVQLRSRSKRPQRESSLGASESLRQVGSCGRLSQTPNQTPLQQQNQGVQSNKILLF